MKKLALIAALSFSFASSAALADVRYVPGVRVAIGPPALRHEVAPVAPSPRHLWIGGHWAWRGNAHVWLTGHWALPPGPGYAWEPARWENAAGAWTFYEGHWRSSEPVDPAYAYQPAPPPVNPVYVETAPPAPIVEVRPAIPFEGAAWIPGYWHWNGTHHAWVAGRWSARPAGHEWHEHRWEQRADGRWGYQPGRWQPQEREHNDGRDHDRR